MDRKIRVAQVIGNIYEGGVESCILNYFKAIDTSKVSFDFYVERTSKVVDKDLIESLGGRVVIVPHYTHFFQYMKCLRREFKAGGYDIVHANMSTLNIFPLYVAKRVGIKVRISHAHNTANNREVFRAVVKRMLKPFAGLFATRRFACSDYAGRWLFGKRDFTVINNAVDLSRFSFNKEVRKAKRAELGVDGRFVIGHIGRFCPQKNHKFLIDMFKGVLAEKPDAVLILVGEGPDYEEVVSYSKQVGVHDSVIFAGTTSDTACFYQAMDCFVLPSLYEGLPVVSVEAQANGLKCLFSTEITREAGLLKSTEFLGINDCGAWVKKIIGIAASDTVNDRKNGYDAVCNTKYNIRGEAAKLLEIYEGLI